MLSLTVLTIAVAITSALPRGELSGGDEGNLYPGLYRDQSLDEKDGRNLDTVDTLQNNKWNSARFKRNIQKEIQKSRWSKRDGVSAQTPIYHHRYFKKEGGTLDSLGGGHLIRNLQGMHDNKFDHEIKKESFKFGGYRTDPSKTTFNNRDFMVANRPDDVLDSSDSEQLVRDFFDPLDGGRLLPGVFSRKMQDSHLARDFLDSLGRAHESKMNLISKNRNSIRDMLDSLGGGHLLRGLDYLRDGHLLKGSDSLNEDRLTTGSRTRDILDSLGGGHLIRNIDSIGGGHLTRDILDPIGGGHLVRGLESKGGDHLTRDILDSIGGGHLVRGLDSKKIGHSTRDILDSIGGGHLVRGLESKEIGHSTRDILDSIGGGHLVRGLEFKEIGHSTRDILDSIGGGHLVRGLDPLEVGHLIRSSGSRFAQSYNSIPFRETMFPIGHFNKYNFSEPSIGYNKL